MSEIKYVTLEGYQKIQEELERLEIAGRKEISDQIAEAADKGDLSENSEYKAAKESQELLELRISKLKEKLSISRILDGSQIDHSKVSILSEVKIKNMTLGGEHIYKIVPDGEANLSEGKISIDTPIAKGLLGKKKNQIAKIELPNKNILELKILEISA